MNANAQTEQWPNKDFKMAPLWMKILIIGTVTAIVMYDVFKGRWR